MVANSRNCEFASRAIAQLRSCAIAAITGQSRTRKIGGAVAGATLPFLRKSTYENIRFLHQNSWILVKGRSACVFKGIRHVRRDALANPRCVATWGPSGFDRGAPVGKDKAFLKRYGALLEIARFGARSRMENARFLRRRARFGCVNSRKRAPSSARAAVAELDIVQLRISQLGLAQLRNCECRNLRNCTIAKIRNCAIAQLRSWALHNCAFANLESAQLRNCAIARLRNWALRNCELRS